MFVTRQADYAVRCVLYLSRNMDRVISATEISKSMSIPRSFLAKILQRLSRQGIVKSTQGITGGFELARKPERVNILEVIEAMQGPPAVNVCAVDKKTCDLSNSCVIHPLWVELREDIEKKLKKESFGGMLKKGRKSRTR